MTERSQGRAAHLSWLWVLPLLLAAALAIPQLDHDAFHADESSSLIVAGALRPGPWSLAEVWSAVARRSPEQALGWPMLLSVWGRVAGWSEVTVRALPFFSGLLDPRLGRPHGPRPVCATGRIVRHIAAGGFRILPALPVLCTRFLAGGLPWHLVPLALLARRLAAATSGPRRTDRPAAGCDRFTVHALLRRLAAACARPVSSALRPEEPALVATCPPLRAGRPGRCPATANLCARAGSGLQATAVYRTGP